MQLDHQEAAQAPRGAFSSSQGSDQMEETTLKLHLAEPALANCPSSHCDVSKSDDTSSWAPRREAHLGRQAYNAESTIQQKANQLYFTLDRRPIHYACAFESCHHYKS